MELTEQDSKKCKVLICDDESDILDLTQYILEESGYSVIAVNDSLQVIGKIKKELPDLVLIDLAMPGMSGDEIVSYLKQQKKLNAIPVIIFSASRDGQTVAFQAGANDFLAKPFDIDQLLKLIAEHIKPA